MCFCVHNKRVTKVLNIDGRSNIAIFFFFFFFVHNVGQGSPYGHNDLLMLHSIASLILHIHKILSALAKQYRRFTTETFLLCRSNIKIQVTVTYLWYLFSLDVPTHQIWSSRPYRTDDLRQILFSCYIGIRDQNLSHSDLLMVCDTLNSLDVCYEQKYENYQNFSPENFHFLVVKFSVYLNWLVFVMKCRALKSKHIVFVCYLYPLKNSYL